MTSSSTKDSAASAEKKRAVKISRRDVVAGRGSRLAGRDREFVAGVDIGGSNLRVALADHRGNIAGKWNTSTKASSTPDMVIAQILEGLDHLLRQSSSPPRSLLSVAVGAPGATDPKTGVVLATSYLKGWKNVPLRQMLEARLGVPVVIENDVRMAALGEHWRGAAQGVDDFVFLAIGTGIGAGVFANGKLIHGAQGTAGEVGYMLAPHATDAPARPGEPGALENIIGGHGIQRQWLNLCASPQNLAPTEIFDRASRDPLAKRVLDYSAQLLAHAVYNISLVLNSALFILGGGIGVNAALYDATKGILERYNTPSVPNITVSSLGTEAQIIGAIRLALAAAKREVPG